MRVPILMYHSISDDNNPLSVNLSNFEKQMSFLHKSNFKSVNFDSINKNEIKKKFIITFDDGYKNVFVNALPILLKFNFTATIFLVSDLIGKFNKWDMNKENFFKYELMDLDDIKKWLSNGMSIGCHTANHFNLKNLDESTKKKEIVEPKFFFKDKLSYEVNSFSYPYGSYDDQSAKIVKENYKYAVTTNRSRYVPNKFTENKIPRVPVNNKDNLFKFYIKINTFYEDIKFDEK